MGRSRPVQRRRLEAPARCVCADPTRAAAMCLPSQARRKCDRIKRCSLLCAHVVIRSMTGIEKCAMSQDELAALLQQRGRKRKLKNSVVLQVCAQPSCMLSLCRLTMWPDRTEAACACVATLPCNPDRASAVRVSRSTRMHRPRTTHEPPAYLVLLRGCRCTPRLWTPADVRASR